MLGLVIYKSNASSSCPKSINGGGGGGVPGQLKNILITYIHYIFTHTHIYIYIYIILFFINNNMATIQLKNNRIYIVCSPLHTENSKVSVLITSQTTGLYI